MTLHLYKLTVWRLEGNSSERKKNYPVLKEKKKCSRLRANLIRNRDLSILNSKNLGSGKSRKRLRPICKYETEFKTKENRTIFVLFLGCATPFENGLPVKYHNN